MPYAKLRNEILLVREERESRRSRTAINLNQTLIQLTLNLPGPDKAPSGSGELFHWGVQQILATMASAEIDTEGHDVLGPWALIVTSENATRIKQQAIVLENSIPAGRLLDIDVYSQDGVQVSRRDIESPSRPCLICENSAVDCIRNQTHNPAQLRASIDELLSSFRP